MTSFFKRNLLYLFMMVVVFSCSKPEQLSPPQTTSENFAVSKDEALKLATIANAPANARISGGVSKKVKEMKEFKEARGKTVFYTVNYEDNKGFLLLSADRRMTPVLAYSDEGSFSLDTDNPGVQLWKDLVTESFKGVEKNAKAHIDIINDWKHFEKGNASNGRTTDAPVWTPEASCEYFVTHPIPANVTIEHMTDNLTQWGQEGGYNAYCPNNNFLNCSPSCGKAPTGCGPVAIGQVLRYHRKATSISGRNYTTAMFDAMPRSLSSSNCSPTVESQQNVAHLLRDVGSSVNATYNTPNILLGPQVSGTGCQTWNTPGQTDDFFSGHGYTSFDIDFFASSSEDVVRNELLAHRPVIVFGSNCSTCLTNAHIWVIDGVQDLHAIYQNQDGFCYEHRVTLYQMNWGWKGSENSGWFNYTNITGAGTLYNSSNMKAYIVRP